MNFSLPRVSALKQAKFPGAVNFATFGAKKKASLTFDKCVCFSSGNEPDFFGGSLTRINDVHFLYFNGNGFLCSDLFAPKRQKRVTKGTS